MATPPNTIQNLQSRIRINQKTGCWIWTGPLRYGYGDCSFKGIKTRRVHKVFYILFKGPVPTGLVLDHLCRNRACVNPGYLEPVTARENTLRGRGITARAARKKRCKYGHAFTPVNTRTGTDGSRICRTCTRRLSAEQHERERARRA
jgi:hypothetical protein